MRNVCILLFIAACGGKTPAPSNQVPQPPPDQGSASGEPTGAVCGSRGVPECPENMFCNYAPGASCGEADAPGHCAVKPEACTMIYKPVCGCDGKTYGNSCDAAAHAVGVRDEGECK